MEISYNIIIFIVSCFILIRSGIWTVQSLTRISHFLGWKEFVVAFILMAFATSIPELFVGISSALNKVPSLSFGNILGANIIDLTLAIFIIVLILGNLGIERSTVKRNSIFMAIVAALPLLLISDGNLTRIDGCVLILAFIFYMVWLFDRKDLFTKVYEDTPKVKDRHSVRGYLKDLGVFFGSVFFLLISSQGIIYSASFFASSVGVPIEAIGILLIGAGTALPEIYFSIQAGRTGQSPMILGNLMGSVVINSTLVLGIVALISPIVIDDFFVFSLARIILIVSIVYFMAISLTRDKICRREAIGLILIYLTFVILEVFIIYTMKMIS